MIIVPAAASYILFLEQVQIFFCVIHLPDVQLYNIVT